MSKLNLDYLYEFQKERYIYHWNIKLCFRKKLYLKEYENVIAIPAHNSYDALKYGCLIDSNKNIINESLPYCSNYKKRNIDYEFNNESLQCLDEEYVFLGYFRRYGGSFYGHFLMDFTHRIWAMEQGKKGIYILDEDSPSFNLIPVIKRFFELLNIDISNIIFINKPTFIKKILIPEPAYITGVYYSQDYINIFNKIIQNILPTIEPKEKIFFSRTKFNNNTINKEFGNELLDDLFKCMGFYVISPEDEILDNQIYLMRNAKELGIIQGTQIHTLIYTHDIQQKLYLVNKHYSIPQQYFDSLMMSNKVPIFLDFYTCKYPTSISTGPFLFLFNINMQNFIKDNNVLFNKLSSFSDSYKIESIANYEYRYPQIFNKWGKKIPIPINFLDRDYFDNHFIYSWINDYLPLIRRANPLINYNSPLDILHDMEKSKMILNDLLNNQTCNVPNILYTIHISNIGWLPEVISGYVAGYENSLNSIEALKIKFINCDLPIFYQVYYKDSGWADIATNGGIAGSTGKRRSINGLNIWLENADAQQWALEYRVYSNAWSTWIKGGDSIIVDDMMYALEIKIQKQELPSVQLPNKTIDVHINESAKRINKLSKLNNANNYLEIGLYRGGTFQGVQLPFKCGTDPNLLLKEDDYNNNADVYFFDLTSNEFFNNIALYKESIWKKNIIFDIIYIDGLHTFQQVIQDFMNSQQCTTHNSIWVFDDTLPCDPYSSIQNGSNSQLYRSLAGLKRGPWHGDVYKFVFALHDFYPTFSYATVIDCGNPQTVVWHTDEVSNRNPVIGDMQKILYLNYFDLIDNYKILNPIHEENLEQSVGKLYDNNNFENIELNEIIHKLIVG